MATSMLDSVLSLVTPEMQQTLASRFGASTQAIQGGLTATTAATLGGLAAKAGDSGFLNQILSLAGSANSSNVLGSLSGLAAGDAAGGIGDLVERFLPMVFGSQQSQVTSAIAQSSGLGAASVGGLLKMAAPLVLGFLGRAQSTGSLNAASLGSTLQAELPTLKGYLPTGLLSGLGSGVGVAATALSSGARTVAAQRPRWLLPAAAVAAALLLAILLVRNLGPKPVTPTASTIAPAMTGGVSAGPTLQVKLPDGTVLNVPSAGVEARLVQYLNDGTSVVTDETWFDFDRLLFNSGSATLEPISQEQINNVAAILKAYPNAKVRIGGYTDNTGDADANLKLSQARAETVVAQLTSLGVDPSRIDAKGYGEEHPVADNTTDQGRQKNRRIAIRVAEK